MADSRGYGTCCGARGTHPRPLQGGEKIEALRVPIGRHRRSPREFPSLEGLGVGSRRYRRGQTVTYNFAAPGSPADVKTKLSASSFRNVCGLDWHLLSQSWPGPLVRNKPRARGPGYVGVATACSLSTPLLPLPPPSASLLLRSAAVSLPPFPGAVHCAGQGGTGSPALQRCGNHHPSRLTLPPCHQPLDCCGHLCDY